MKFSGVVVGRRKWCIECPAGLFSTLGWEVCCRHFGDHIWLTTCYFDAALSFGFFFLCALFAQKLWPRAAALAERFWSDPDPENELGWIDADHRMQLHRHRLVTRFIHLRVSHPSWFFWFLCLLPLLLVFCFVFYFHVRPLLGGLLWQGVRKHRHSNPSGVCNTMVFALCPRVQGQIRQPQPTRLLEFHDNNKCSRQTWFMRLMLQVPNAGRVCRRHFLVSNT